MCDDHKINQFTISPLNLTFYRLCFLFGCLLIPALVFSQQMRKNEKGEQIIVYPDGSWQYYSDYLNGEKNRNQAEF